MTECPEIGRWRAYLDGEAAAEEMARLTAHLDGCAHCRTTVAELRATAEFVGSRLLTAMPADATQRAWARMQPRLREPIQTRSLLERMTQMVLHSLSRPARLALSGAVATLAVLLVLALTPAGSQALQALSIFRVQKFKAVTIEVDRDRLSGRAEEAREEAREKAHSTDPVEARRELEQRLAEVGISLKTSLNEQTVREVADLAAARAAAPAGVSVRTVADLPAVYANTAPKVQVADPSTTSMTVDLTAFRKALAEAKKDAPEEAQSIDPNNLPGIDPNVKSITATVQTAFSVVQSYGEGEQALIFLQGGSPELRLSEGIDILAIRDALLAMPNISQQTRSQILSIKDDEWDRTLIIPVPEGTIVKDVSVGGAFGTPVGGEPGLLLLSPEGKSGAVLWQRDGILYAVAGGYGEDVLLRAANSVR
jgi:anti-sigma factor RsiW